ncbi:glycosyl hydrolase [Marinicrinis sediminis]|uniref:Glycosyl hydrolase n=1 Tax=Marinicrinis sediminis TaxID=1652465 RepID=A0ABW5REQ0_9BACL
MRPLRTGKKGLAMLLALLLVLTAGMPAYAQNTQSSSQEKGHWATASLDKWQSYGILLGDEKGKLHPDAAVTRAEMAALINRLFGFTETAELKFTDVNESDWFAEDLSKATAAGYMAGYPDQTSGARKAMTREEAVSLLARVFKLKADADASDAVLSLSAFSDHAEIQPYARPAMQLFAENDWIKGYPNGTIWPQASLTRAEALALMDRLVTKLYNRAGTYGNETVKGHVLVNQADVQLKNMTIEGNLYLTEGIGEGDAALQNVQVRGTIFIEGGGVNTVKLEDVTAGTLQVQRKQGKVRIVASGQTQLDELLVTHDALVEVEEGVTIEKLIIDESAAGIELNIKGSIEQLDIRVEGIKINGQTVGKGTHTVKKGQVSESAKPATPTPGTGGRPTTEPTVLRTFTFDSGVEGWEQDGTWKAEFGDPALTHTDVVGDGALQLNAAITDDTQSWQEVRIKHVEVPQLAQATKIVFDAYWDLNGSDLADYPDSKLKPYLVVQQTDDWNKIGEGVNIKSVSQLETVQMGDLTLGKFTVENILLPDQAAGKSKLYIGLVSSGLRYTGPIYIDNVKLLQAPLGGTDEELEVEPDPNQPAIDTADFDESDVVLVDEMASAKTRSLFAYLKNITGDTMLFGHQHATTQGLTISQGDGTESDVKNAVGAFPAVYGWDTLSLTGNEEPFTPEATAEVMKLAYERDGILTLSAHMPNFVTGDSMYGTSRVVEQILPGGAKHSEYNAYLDMIADFANGLKDDQGEWIPVIFRPFHENNGGWFWWGAPYSSVSEYKNIFRYTVEYLRDVKGVHNFLYAYSPNGPFHGEEDYLQRYPGDEYVDMIGMDQYDGTFTEGWMDGLVEDAAMISRIAEERGKISALTEVGPKDNNSGVLINGNKNVNWFTDLLEKIKADEDARNVTYLLTWRNGSMDHFWVPYRNHPVYGNNEMLADFIRFYNDPYTSFNDRLQDVYTLDVDTAEKDPFMYMVTPTNGQKVTGEITVRAGVFDQEVTRVAYSVDGADEVNMELAASGYYEAVWMPTAEQNGGEAEVTVTAYLQDSSSVTDTATVIIYAETLIDRFDFTGTDEGASYEGSWVAAGSGSGTVSHTAAAGNGGAIQLDVEMTDDGNDSNWTYQELKVKLPSVHQTVYMPHVNRIQYDILMPQGTPDSLFKPYAIAYLEPDGFVKLGEGMTEIQLDDFTPVDGMLSYTVTIDFTAQPNVKDLVLALVSNDWNYSGPVYIDNVVFYRVEQEPQQDPSLIDDFESYNGDNGVLGESYTSNGDAVTLTLSEEQAYEGSYGLAYAYNIDAAGYGGRSKTFSGIDWTPFNQLQFWLVPDGQDQKLVIQVNAGGVHFEAYPSLAETTGRLVEIPFSEFRPAGWESNQTARLEGDYLKDIQKFSIYVNAQAGVDTISGVLYFDDIIVSADGTGTGGDGGSGAGGDSGSDDTGPILADFEGSTENWSGNNVNGDLAVSADWSAHGSSSLKAPVLLGNKQVEVKLTKSYDFTGKTTLQATVKQGEAGQYGSGVTAKLFVKTGSGWTWHDSGSVAVTSAGTVLSLDLSTVANVGDIKEIGIEFSCPADSSGEANLYIDHLLIQ